MRRSSPVVWLLGVWLAACTEPNPVPPTSDLGVDPALVEAGVAGTDASGDSQRDAPRDGAGDGAAAHREAGRDGLLCAPGAFLTCSSSTQMVRCNSSGTGTVSVSCAPDLCDAALQRCAQCDPKATAYCNGNELVSCTTEGIIVKTPCPGACQSGACVACSKTKYYQDADGDGHGNPAVSVDACAKPAGFVATALDCDDLDPAAHPGQTAFFINPTKGTKSFDYNCDKAEERQSSMVVNCAASAACAGEGWVGAVPACGIAGTWGRCNKRGRGSSCGMTSSPSTQGCR